MGNEEAGVRLADRISVGAAFAVIDNDGTSGYLAQSVLPLYFGLGEAEKVDQIEVDWPSGRRQILTGLGANQTLQINEPR